MRKRPTADDRRLADIFRGMKPGNYTVSVEDTTQSILGLAKLKTEGSIEIELKDKIIFIAPDVNR